MTPAPGAVHQVPDDVGGGIGVESLGEVEEVDVEGVVGLASEFATGTGGVGHPSQHKKDQNPIIANTRSHRLDSMPKISHAV
jgi:hypothetical protein